MTSEEWKDYRIALSEDGWKSMAGLRPGDRCVITKTHMETDADGVRKNRGYRVPAVVVGVYPHVVAFSLGRYRECFGYHELVAMRKTGRLRVGGE